ncbi:MAG: hypothetical protein K2N56_05155 [Oscillospiraceae bacterium]|nr:hypothetical protein [Oscillospiraceae bacterium]
MDNILELERQAWRGILDYSMLPACEFKFLATVEQLGIRCRRDNIPAELLREDVVKARKVYQCEREQFDHSAEMYGKYQDAIIKSDALRIAITKAKGVDKLPLALECIELLTGEGGFAARNLRDMED